MVFGRPVPTNLGHLLEGCMLPHFPAPGRRTGLCLLLWVPPCRDRAADSTSSGPPASASCGVCLAGSQVHGEGQSHFLKKEFASPIGESLHLALRSLGW